MAGRKVGFWKRMTVIVVKPAMTLMSRRHWRGMEHIPKTGPVIIVANHISHADPLVLAHNVYDAGRWPVFLAKSGVFRVPLVGRWLRAVEQTPVERGTVDLDEPVVSYLPQFALATPGAAGRIRVRHLLTHTSGIDADLFFPAGCGPGAPRPR